MDGYYPRKRTGFLGVALPVRVVFSYRFGFVFFLYSTAFIIRKIFEELNCVYVKSSLLYLFRILYCHLPSNP